ncbi:MAG: hypothetical protein K6F98_00020 [Bacteroidales bacterium]|nr:hypothetical protein [Bacteroidales bacterium]
MRQFFSFLLLLTPWMVFAETESAAPLYRFDFGSAAAAEGYIPVTSATLYSDDLGYGFETTAGVSDVVNKKGTALTRDYVTSDLPFKFSVRLPEGNYRVTLTLGNTEGTSCTTVKSEIRRLMVERAATAKKEIKTVSFNVNIRTPQLSKNNQMKLNSSEMDYETGAIKKITWDDRLTLQFNDEAPCVCAMEIAPADSCITVFIIGDSTVTDQSSGGTWGQYLPRWFDDGVAVANHAESGMTIKGFRFGRRWDKIMESCKEGDYLFIQLGTNDEKSRGHDPMWDSEDLAGDWVRTHSAADKDYIWELAAMAVEARRHGVTPVIVSPMTKINRSNATATDLMTPYGQNAPKAAELAECAFIDLWGMSMDIVRALGQDALAAYSDGTHTDNYGAYLFSLCIAKGIRENNLDLQRHLAADTPDIDPKAPKPALQDFDVPQEPRGGRSGQSRQPSAPAANGWTPMGPL